MGIIEAFNAFKVAEEFESKKEAEKAEIEDKGGYQ